ncbi:hypothetical protein HYU06_04100 [Candidatus Woesearchaeota archaeon]|nr:hypothetical protein [Candidatus Woesearchaeota archaeon]
MATQQLVFKSNVSRGSAFNQIYIPKSLKDAIMPGDEVEVRLLNKAVKLCYSKNLKRLNSYKENLIESVFKEISSAKISDKVNAIFVVGSFLAEAVNYNDIDLVLLAKETKEEIKENELARLTLSLGTKLSQKFHITTIKEDKLQSLIEYCPITKSMFNAYVANKEIKLNLAETKINPQHIEFLLMMPEDLLTTTLSSRIFLDNLRVLVTIDLFLENKELSYYNMMETQQTILGDELYARMKSNDLLFEDEIENIRKIFREKIKNIRKKLK